MSPDRVVFQPVLPSRLNATTRISGDGAPEGVVISSPGQVYTDNLSDNLYIKVSGTQTIGWRLIGKWTATAGGGSGTAQVFSGGGNPNGVVTPSGSAALYYDTSTGVIWQWNGSAWI
jgi:hypothetical protein